LAASLEKEKLVVVDDDHVNVATLAPPRTLPPGLKRQVT
jgi:hypothetical protein